MLLHITQKTDWETAVSRGIYQPPSLHHEGFIHCSLPEQVLLPANTLFHNQPDLVLLVIDPEHLQIPIFYEDCYQSGQNFPHIYGPLNLNAVTHILPFPPNPDGTFSLPDVLTQHNFLT